MDPRINQNHNHSRDFSSPGKPQPGQPSVTRGAVKSTPSERVARIASQRAHKTVQDNPPPFSRHTVDREPITSPSPLTIDQHLDNISQQLGALPSEQLQTDIGARLARQLLKLFGEARDRRDFALMQKAAGLTQQLLHIVGPQPTATNANTHAIVSKIASTLSSALTPWTLDPNERYTVGDWLAIEVDGDPDKPPCEMVGMQLFLDSQELATDNGRHRAHTVFDLWLDAHLRDPKGLRWKELVQVINQVEQALGWKTETAQWLRLQTIEARRSQDARPLNDCLDSLPQEPLDSTSLHNIFELCRTGGLPEKTRVELIGRLLPRLPLIAAEPAIHDECLGAIQRIDDDAARQSLVTDHRRRHPAPASLRLPRALGGPWRERCQDLVEAWARQWTQAPGSAPQILAAMRRLAASPDGNDANTVERQFLLLRELLSAIDPSQQAACLADLHSACDGAIDDARTPASGPCSTATPPTLTGLRCALQALSVIHLDASLSHNRSEALLTEWLVALHAESTQPEEAMRLFRRIRFAHHTITATTVDGENAPLNPLLRGLFTLHDLPA